MVPSLLLLMVVMAGKALLVMWARQQQAAKTFKLQASEGVAFTPVLTVQLHCLGFTIRYVFTFFDVC